MLSTPPSCGEVPDDDLSQSAYWLLTLHPDAVPPKFRNANLTTMDESAKRALIAEMESALWLAPLKGDML